MQLRTLGSLAAGFGLWLGTTSAAEPGLFNMPSLSRTDKSAKTDSGEMAANQKLADAVAAKVSAAKVCTNADLDITANGGAVTVMGMVKDDAQKMAILEVVRRVDGVKLVRDGVQTPKVNQMQALGGPFAAPAPSGMMPTAQPMPMGMPPAMMQGNPQIAEAYPVGPGGGMEGMAPPLPPNAWPTYAPYNNVSRVAYPTAYPYNAFPFIGPYYPFPKVPLGWRKVTLEWEDGHWWLGRKQAPIDYWRVKFGY